MPAAFTPTLKDERRVEQKHYCEKKYRKVRKVSESGHKKKTYEAHVFECHTKCCLNVVELCHFINHKVTIK